MSRLLLIGGLAVIAVSVQAADIYRWANADGARPATSSSATVNAGQTADCATLFRRYRESQECFAPYRMANGALRAEAYRRCKEVADPSRQCGPTPNYAH